MTRQPVTIQATYRIVTPMFCAGADQQTAELRLPSFKGALRFWWRSLMWGKVEDHRELREREATLFGSSEQRFGQSKVRLRFISKELQPQVRTGERLCESNVPGLCYLGYGVMNFRGELLRPAIGGGTFSIECGFSRLTSEEQIDEVRRALILLGAVGGLGSKSRKGFGSVTLTKLIVNGEPQMFAMEPCERLKNAIGTLPDGLPDWTAWSNLSRAIEIPGDGKPLYLLNRLGQALADFRVWNDRQTSRFAEDHDLMFNYLRDGVTPDHPPERIAFGLPHNYFFRSLSNPPQLNVKAEVVPEKRHDGNNLTRRGSPLFLHICDISEGSPTTKAVFLPAKFLPDGERVTITDTSTDRSHNRHRHSSANCQVPEQNLWKPVQAFLDHLKNTESLTAQEVSLV